jgi:hypothetical protein
MNKQVRDLIEAGYVTRKQAAAILGKGDGGNITKLCKDAGVKYIEIPCGTKTTTLFVGVEVVRLFEKMDKRNRPKQAELPVMPKLNQGINRTPSVIGTCLDGPIVRTEYLDPMDVVQKPEVEIMEALGRIEAMLTALLGRRDVK